MTCQETRPLSNRIEIRQAAVAISLQAVDARLDCPGVEVCVGGLFKGRGCMTRRTILRQILNWS